MSLLEFPGKAARTLLLTAVALVAILLGVVGGMASIRIARQQVAADIYRARLETLSADYHVLRGRYNEAIRRTAVTELLVKNGALSVRVRDAEGVERVVETPFNPAEEIYVDYVVLQGRLWIRRVFDAKTPPWRGMVIDPPLENLDWSDPRLAHGKAVYRALSEGRWIVSVSGDGSLGLARVDEDSETPLTPIPEIRDYAEIEREVADAVERIDLADVLGQLTGGRRPSP